MTLLQRTDGDDADSGVSYLDLVSFIKSECADTTANLEELFRRVLFSVCVSNTDDHYEIMDFFTRKLVGLYHRHLTLMQTKQEQD